MNNVSLSVKEGYSWFGHAGFGGPAEHLDREGHTVRNL